MVHLVRKKIKGRVYLYVQRTITVNGKNKTEHIRYLGHESKYTQDQINKIIEEEDKNETRRITRQARKRKH